MPHMPEIRDVSGKARYEGETLHFDVKRGNAVNLTVTDGTIDLTGLDKPSQMAAIRLPITGSAQDVIRFLARPKLGLPKETLYDHRRLGGNVAVDVSLSFPLIDALTVAEIDIAADAQLTSFSLKDVLGEVDLTDATARVKYGNSELSVVGQGKLDGNAVDVTWREMFVAKAPFRRRYDVRGTVPSSIVEKAGFPLGRTFRRRPDRHHAPLPGGAQRHRRGLGTLRHEGGQAGRDAAGLEQGGRRRRAGDHDPEARNRRQDHHRRLRRPRRDPADQGTGPLRSRQQRPADRPAAGEDRPDRHRGRLAAPSGRNRHRGPGAVDRDAARSRHDERPQRGGDPRAQGGGLGFADEHQGERADSERRPEARLARLSQRPPRPDRQAAVERKIERANEERRVTEIVGGLADMPDDPTRRPDLDDYQARAAEATPPDASPEVRAQVSRMASIEQARADQAWQAKRGRAATGALDWLGANPAAPLMAMPTALRDGLSPEQTEALDRTAMNGGRVVTDRDLYDRLDDQSVRDPESFVGVDLTQHRLSLGDSDYDRLTKLQQALAEGKSDPAFERHRLGRLFLEEGLRNANLDPNGAEARPARQQLDRLLGAFEPVEGRPPTMVDIRRLVGDVLPRANGDPTIVRVADEPTEANGNTQIAPLQGPVEESWEVEPPREPALGSSEFTAKDALDGRRIVHNDDGS
ncbi:hypothetical protein OSTOST_12671, partial [Ostertagia ostertagi]